MDGSSPPLGGSRTLAGRYDLHDLVGAGGVANVWRATDTRLGRQVAVKILSGPAANDPTHRRRIEREAQALARITHPNVVAVYDYGEAQTPDGRPLAYVVMELVEGADLAGRLAREGPCEPEETTKLIAGVLDGVSQAHAIGIVHGDLKPANVLLSPGGPKVGDFGVARILAEETGTTELAATPAYAAPEVLRGRRPTVASDVYSAGCIAFEALTGRPPFTGQTLYEVADQHQRAPVPSAAELRGGVSPQLDATIRRALAKDPSERFGSAASFAAALRAVSAPEAPIAPAPAEEDQTPADPLPDEPEPPEQPAPGEPESPATVPVSRPATEVIERPVRRSPLEPVGAIIRRIPVGLALAVVGVVLLMLMKGQATASVQVPELIGVPLEQAEARASDAGFVTEVRTVPQGGRQGTVVAQQPAPGALASRGSTVILDVTAGAPQTVVPDVVGRPLDEAQRLLEQARLGIGDVLFRVSEAAPGTVLETDPPPGAEVDEHTSVELVVAPRIVEGDGDDDGGAGGGPPPGRGRGRG